MEIRKVGALNGWMWIRQGLTLTGHNPVWTLLLALLVIGALNLAAMIAFLAPLTILVTPVLIAGYMRACLAMQRHEQAILGQLLAGFKQQTPRLLALGGVMLGGIIFASLVTAAVGGEEFVTLLRKAQDTNDPAVLSAALEAGGGGVLAGASILLALAMFLQFAPMLVLFNGETPIGAMKSSVLGILRNFLPYTLYSLIMFALLLVLALLPPALGAILLFTVSMTSLYSAYRDIFPAPEIPAPAADAPGTDQEPPQF